MLPTKESMSKTLTEYQKTTEKTFKCYEERVIFQCGTLYSTTLADQVTVNELYFPNVHLRA